LTETFRSCYLPPEHAREKRESIGIPIPGVDIAVVREDGTLAEVGEVGELVHCGDFICLGYWNDEVATSNAIRADPLMPPESGLSSRSFFTGDIGFRDEQGFIYYTGRRDRLLKSMGVRVNPHEVEELLLETGAVSEVAVIGLPHEMLGHEIFAFIVPFESVENAEKTVRNAVKEAMSRYMLPREFLVVKELPRTTSGKVDYPALMEIAKARHPRQ